MKQTSVNVKRLVFTAMLGAVYTALTFFLAPLSYGAVQCRVAEALTLWAVFTPLAIPGLTLGCFLANLLGLSTGAVTVGVADVIVGPLATGIAAWLSWKCRQVRVKGLPVLSALAPVVLNALAVGTELTLVSPNPSPAVWLTQAGLVAAGEMLACLVLGLPLVKMLEVTGVADRLFGKD